MTAFAIPIVIFAIIAIFSFYLSSRSSKEVLVQKSPKVAHESVLNLGEDNNLQLFTLNHFEDWAKGVGKVYPDEQEKLKRFHIFVESLHQVLKHNQERESTYSLGLTYYADWTEQEFNDYFQFQKRHDCWTAEDRKNMKAKGTISGLEPPVEASLLPRSIDWREKGVVTPVKNQGHCGSCWAFAATGNLEAAYAKRHGQQVLVSEQQLLDCSGSYGNFGCSGGFPARAFEYLRHSGGIDTETSYPYQMASNGSRSCRFHNTEIGVKVQRVVNITEFDEKELQVAVGLIGPVTVAFVVAQDFRLYSGGVYSTPTCGSPRAKDLTHAVLVVGYGKSEEGKKYWIVKNSWGEGWGMKGYFLMERGTNMCGISDCAAYPVVE